MTWVRCDDGIAWNGKFRRAGLEALGLFVAALGYCNDHLTDGFIKKSDICLVVPNVPEKKLLALAERLCSNQDPDEPDSKPSWIKESKGWRVHDFHHYQPSRAEVIEARERERDRKSRWRRRITDSCPGGTNSDVPTGQTAGQTPVSHRDSTPESAHPVPSRPVPSRPESATHEKIAGVGDSWLSAARDRILAVYPPEHTGGDVDAERAIYELARLGILVPDGEIVRHRHGTTVESFCRAIEAWKRSEPWQRGKIHSLRNFAEKGVYLTPAPLAKPADSRRAAGANETTTTSRVQKIV